MVGYNNIQAYRNAFASVDKLNQIIMLYDTAIASLQQAKQAIVDKNIEERFNKVAKAFDIITGLRDSLDHTNGGELASVLADWYSGTVLRILSINRTLDLEQCELTISHIKQMRDAWLEVEKQIKGNAGSAESQTAGAADASSNTSSGNIEAVANNNDFFVAAIRKAAYGTASSGNMVINV